MNCPIGSAPYEVERGDTFAKIAKRFSLSLDDLLLLNPDADPENLSVGQTLCIGRVNRPETECRSGNFYVARKGDSVYSIAQSFELDVNDIFAANPDLTENLEIGDVICIPLNPLRIEIVINITAKMLTVYRNGAAVNEYPVATGKPDTPTPIGVFEVINKQLDPDGPYGTRWLGLSKRGYGIHGTNNPASIGTAASNGCIRMYNEDVERLFDITNPGTVVRILP